MHSKALIFLFVILSPLAWGGFDSVYLSFYTPDNWICKTFGVNHVCHHKKPQINKIPFIIVSAKMGVKSDTLEMYPQDNAKLLVINSHKWLDFLPDESLKESITSRKQKTVCCKSFDYTFHTIVNFYIPSEVYPQYAGLMFRIMNSFTLDKKKILEIRLSLENQNPRDLQRLQSYIQQILLEEDDSFALVKKEESFKGVYLLLLFAVLTMVFFFWFFRKKHNKRRKKRKLIKRRKKKR